MEGEMDQLLDLGLLVDVALGLHDSNVGGVVVV